MIPCCRECFIFFNCSIQELLVCSQSSAIKPLFLLLLVILMSNSLQSHGLWPTRLLCLWSSPDKTTLEGVVIPFPKGPS